MDSAFSIFQSLRRYRSYLAAAGLAISLLLPGLGFGQATEAKNESQSNAGDALIPLTSGPPHTAREEEMLRLTVPAIDDADPEETAIVFGRVVHLRSVWQSL